VRGISHISKALIGLGPLMGLATVTAYYTIDSALTFEFAIVMLLTVVTVLAAAWYWISVRSRQRTRELRIMNQVLRKEAHERKIAQKSAEEFRVEIENSSRLKDEFLSTLSHELRTPANVILGFSELLVSEELSPSERIEAASAIHRSAKAQTEMINQLLDLSKIVNGKMILKSENTSINSIIRSVHESTQLGAIAKGISLRTELPVEDLMIFGDPSRIQQILWHLVSNAIKFTPSGGSVSIGARRAEGLIEIWVQDTGDGINPDFTPHLFEKFKQQDGSKTRRHGGLGLGLSLVRHLTELHGGTVSAISEGAGCGSCFFVRIPALRRVGSSALSRQRSIEGVRALVVDDAPDALELVTAILRRYGAVVRTARSAEEAMSTAKEFRPDVLISDIAMPEEDGYSLIKRIREGEDITLRRLPAAALTAFTSDEHRDAAIRAGFQIHIPKPIDTRRLLDGIKALRRMPNEYRAVSN
jgi:signal transduction histidine kinase/CheY-like chemotaxis protein